MGRGRIPVTSYSEMPARGRAEAHERTAGRRKVVRAERIDTVKTTPAETNRWRHVLIGECGHVLDAPFISYAEEPPDRRAPPENDLFRRRLQKLSSFAYAG